MTLKVIIVGSECCCNYDNLFCTLLYLKRGILGLSKDKNFLHLRDGFCEVAVCKENSV